MPGGFAGLVIQVVLPEEDVGPTAFFDEGGCETVGFVVEGDFGVGRAVQKVQGDVWALGKEVCQKEVDT